MTILKVALDNVKRKGVARVLDCGKRRVMEVLRASDCREEKGDGGIKSIRL
jgi:hypothetical protein